MLWVLCTYFSYGILKDYSSYFYQGSWVFAVSLCSGKTLPPALLQQYMHTIGQAAQMHCSQEAFEMQYIRASVKDPLPSDALFCHIRITHHKNSVNQLQMGFWNIKISYTAAHGHLYEVLEGMLGLCSTVFLLWQGLESLCQVFLFNKSLIPI